VKRPPAAPVCWRGCSVHTAIIGLFRKHRKLARRTGVPHKHRPTLRSSVTLTRNLPNGTPKQLRLPCPRLGPWPAHIHRSERLSDAPGSRDSPGNLRRPPCGLLVLTVLAEARRKIGLFLGRGVADRG
jgi:hypothetical protein